MAFQQYLRQNEFVGADRTLISLLPRYQLDTRGFLDRGPFSP